MPGNTWHLHNMKPIIAIIKNNNPIARNVFFVIFLGEYAILNPLKPPASYIICHFLIAYWINNESIVQLNKKMIFL